MEIKHSQSGEVDSTSNLAELVSYFVWMDRPELVDGVFQPTDVHQDSFTHDRCYCGEYDECDVGHCY